MPRRQTRKVTWIEVGVRNAGLRKTIKGLSWAYMWATVREVQGSDPTVEQVANWWKEAERTSYREQAAFREAFPTLETPAKIFQDPALRANLAKAAMASDELDEAIRSRRRISDSGLLDIGMAAATV
jgi:hypothetical protein